MASLHHSCTDVELRICFSGMIRMIRIRIILMSLR